MCSSADPRRSGFVLLEAVVALAIIGLVAIALLETTGAQLRTASQANTLLIARGIAQDRLAALEILSYDELGSLPDSLVSGTMPPPFDDFAWTASVVAMEDEYDLWGAEVVVTGRGESFPLRTLVHTPRPVLETEVTNGTGGTGGRGGTGGTGGRGATPTTGGRTGGAPAAPRGGG
jgi:type II secretory pathway pseudopilin PulG